MLTTAKFFQLYFEQVFFFSEIIKIAQSINDLATIFRELSVLVIEQGTILDRIDYNIEQTMVKVQDGRQQLEKAENY